MDIGEKCQLKGMSKALCKAENVINKEVTDVVQGNKIQRISRRHVGKCFPAPAMCLQTPRTLGKNTRHDPVPREEHFDGGRLGHHDGGGELCGVALA